MQKRKFIKKVSLLGEGAVGKTSLVRRYVLDVFSDDYLQTFGAKVTKKVTVVDDIELTMMIWDILGQKSQVSLHSTYYSGSNGAFVVCDVTRPETLDRLADWIKDLNDVVGDIPIIPLANKKDLPITVSEQKMKEIESLVGNPFIFTSAKTGEGVNEAFAMMAKKMVGGC
ncbi:MAG: GTP-binding protein [Methanomassiliicoccales archaeon]|nr:MAG: GTP-binding protein [Methanomassiliicoccales archaeon]